MNVCMQYIRVTVLGTQFNECMYAIHQGDSIGNIVR